MQLHPTLPHFPQPHSTFLFCLLKDRRQILPSTAVGTHTQTADLLVLRFLAQGDPGVLHAHTELDIYSLSLYIAIYVECTILYLYKVEVQCTDESR
jgi:hypothetical protein